MSYSAPESDTLFLTNLTSSGIATYETLEKPPMTAGSQVELTQAVASSDGEVLMKAFISPALGIESLPVGDFTFDIYGAVSAMDGVSEIVGRVFQRTLAGVETELFNFTTGEVEATTDTPTLYEVTYSTTDIVDTAITDRLVLKMYAKTDYATDITVSLFYLGELYQSRIFLPVNISKITGGDMLTALYDKDQDGMATSAAPANPLSALGDIIYGGDSDGTQTRLPIGTVDYYLKSSSDGIPAWAIGGGGGASSDLIVHGHTDGTDGGLLRLDTLTAPTDSTSLDSSTDMHGLFPKLSGSSDDCMNGKGIWDAIIFPNNPVVWPENNIVLTGSAKTVVLDAGQIGCEEVLWGTSDATSSSDISTNGFVCASGTYSMNLLWIKYTDHGIVKVTIDGTLVLTLDEYGTLARNQISTTAGIVLTAGYHTITFTTAGKNAASTGYKISINKVWFQPAAY